MFRINSTLISSLNIVRHSINTRNVKQINNRLFKLTPHLSSGRNGITCANFSTSSVHFRHRHREFEADGPFDNENEYFEEDYDIAEEESNIEPELTEEELEAEIPYDDFIIPKKKDKLKKPSKKRGKIGNEYYETENNLIYYQGMEPLEKDGEVYTRELRKGDLQYIGDDGSLSLEKLSSSGATIKPIIPVRYISYKLPYSVEGYRNRQRVYEGYDPDASNPTSQFTDMKIVKLDSGKGGDGKVSFFRDAGRSRGPPDGGDGGDGGSVYIQAVESETSSLHKIRYHYKAENGKPGSMSQLTGMQGKDLLLQVPVGTIVRWIPDPKLTLDVWKKHQIEKATEVEYVEEDQGSSEQEPTLNEDDDSKISLLEKKKKEIEEENLNEYTLEGDDTLTEWRSEYHQSADPLNPEQEEEETIIFKNEKMYCKVPIVQERYDPVPLGIKIPRNVYPDGEGWIFRDKGEEYHAERDYFLELRHRVARFDRGIRAQEEAEDYFPIEGLDLDKPGPPILLLRGGKGGLGNMHFLTSNIRNPRFAKRGRGGTEAYFLLELKLLADLGLVGLPNAGKSTLLRSISKARPRVGHWEFTTLRPTIGTIPMGISRPSFTVADIPGIVKGARRENRGMGLDFLRHVERSGGIVFVISLEPKDKREDDMSTSVQDLETLIDEVGPERMRGKKVLVVATKADMPGSEKRFLNLKKFCDKYKWKTIPCCAQKKENVEPIIQAMYSLSGKEEEANKKNKRI